MTKELLFLFISACLLSCFKNNSVPVGETTTFKHIDSLIINSRNTSFSDSLRNDYFQKAISYTDEMDHDSLKIRSNIRLAYSSVALGNMDKFKSLSKKTSEIRLEAVEVTWSKKELTCVSLETGLDGEYFEISSPTVDYYVWFDLDGVSTDPAPVGRTALEVEVVTGYTVANLHTALVAGVEAGDVKPALVRRQGQ